MPIASNTSAMPKQEYIVGLTLAEPMILLTEYIPAPHTYICIPRLAKSKAACATALCHISNTTLPPRYAHRGIIHHHNLTNSL